MALTPGDDPLERLFLDVARATEAVPQFAGYRVLECIGAGGFGTVYRAFDETLQREVALKVLHAPPAGGDAEERFLREARALARVRHPNVLTLFGVVDNGTHRALSTEYVRGRSLADVIAAEAPLELDRVARIGIAVCQALEAVHSAGIVHRDIKSQNVLIEPGGRVVLADFGLGAELAGPRAPEGSPAYVAGTPHFIAPEVLRGGVADERSDLYSVGVLLHHAAAGKLPFQTATDLSSFLSRLERGDRDAVPAPRTAGEGELWKLIEKSLRRSPAERFQSAGDMRRALEAVVGQPRHLRRRVLVSVVLGAAAIAALSPFVFLPDSPAGSSLSLNAAVRAAAKAKKAPVLLLRGDRDFYLYLVREDRRGRLFLVRPRHAAGAESALAAGEDHEVKMSGLEDLSSGDGGDGEGEAMIVLASLQPVAVLVDSLPPRGSSDETGKDGSPRLKPVAVRGLERILIDAGYLPEDEGKDGDDRLSAGLPDLPHSGPGRGGVWAASQRLSPRR